MVWLALLAAAPLAMAQTQPIRDANLALDGNAPIALAASSGLPEAPEPQQQAQQSRPAAQTNTAQPAAQATPQSGGQPPQLTREQQAEQDVKAQEHQRIMGIMPAFNTTNNKDAVPLSAGQKIRLSSRSAVDPWQFGITLAAAGLGQAEDSHPGYGQGMEGYGKRYAASYGDLFFGTLIGNGLLPAALKQDPRFFRMGEGTPAKPNSKLKRFFYAASTNVICKGDNGKWQPNVSNVGGNIISGYISELYYPKSERGSGLVFSNALVVTAEGGIGSELLEFWPDIHRKLFKNKTDSYTRAADQAGQQAPPAPPKQDAPPAAAKP
jgi:hypothetical protein